MKKIAILGSTGSIGTQTVDVILMNPGRFQVKLISGHRNVDLLLEQSLKLGVEHVVITDPDAYRRAGAMNFTAQVHFGIDRANEFIYPENLDLVLNALVGNAGLKTTYAAVSRGVQLALANKESLVTGGEIIMKAAGERNQVILPVDSEHSAIFQCLQGSTSVEVDRLILTASGGPFRGLAREVVSQKTARQALKHPNWDMGRKISIDSATLVNKGLEVIEARWLFDISPERIDVVVHPQSIIHSMVQFADTSIIAQMGEPDMRLPIHYALNYPGRKTLGLKPFDFTQNASLTFEKPDLDTFPGLRLAFEAIQAGGTMPTVYNTVNEMLVQHYLEDKIGFYGITDAIGEAMVSHRPIQGASIDEILALDAELRERYK